MFDKSIPSARMKAWLAAAMVAPIAVFAGGNSWIYVLLIALVCGFVSYVVLIYCERVDVKKPVMGIIQWLWLGVVLGNLAQYSANCWPEADANPVVPLVLIILACVSANKGGENASKVGAVLVWIIVLVIGAVFGAGVTEVRATWLMPSTGNVSITMAVILLIPCLTVFLPVDERKSVRLVTLLLGATAVAVSLWLNGLVGELAATKTENAIYEYSKSISLLGTVERFESVIACVVTAGWFCLLGLVLSTAGTIAETVRSGWGKCGVWGCGTVAVVTALADIDPGGLATTGISAVLWAVIPVLITHRKKDSKKRKNRLDK